MKHVPITNQKDGTMELIVLIKLYAEIVILKEDVQFHLNIINMELQLLEMYLEKLL